MSFCNKKNCKDGDVLQHHMQNINKGVAK